MAVLSVRLHLIALVVHFKTGLQENVYKDKLYYRLGSISSPLLTSVGVIDALDNDSGVVDSVENGFKTPRRATASV